MATTPLAKISAEAKRIRKAHPGKKWATCIQEASKKYRAGSLGGVAAKVSVGKKKAAKPKVTRYATQGGGKVAITAYRGAQGRKTAVTTSIKRISGIDKKYADGKRIIRDIDKVELDLKNTKGKEARAFVIGVINAKHDQLDALTKRKKRA